MQQDKAKKNYTAFIFARGGSKGVKNKNIRSVGGKPLIAHTIACALKSSYIDRVIVSTDSEAIAETARAYGAQTIMRPPELAEDNTPEILAWRHAIASTPDIGDFFISLPATSPLRRPEDIDDGIERFAKGGCDIVFSITQSHNSPYLSMVQVGEDGLLHIVIGGGNAVRRQDVPPVYNITGCVYVANLEYVIKCGRLMEGRVGYIEIPPERAVDIDTEHDLYLADLMLKHPFPDESGQK